MQTEQSEFDEGETKGRMGEKASRRTFLAASAGVATTLGLAGGAGRTAAGRGDEAGEVTTFTVRIENVSTQTTLETSAEGDAANQSVPVSPGAYAVHAEPGPVFTAGEPVRGNGLEALAEDGAPDELASSLAERTGVSDSGAFATAVDAGEPGPLVPGTAYEFPIEASPGDRFSFAAMFVPSNDLFFAPDDRGIGLFDGETPLSGDVTLAVGLWDAGTECNEEPGVGENQAPRQSEPGVGMDEERPVRLITDVGDGYEYPYVPEVIRVTRTPEM